MSKGTGNITPPSHTALTLSVRPALLPQVVSYGGGGRGQPAREVLENPCAENFILFQVWGRTQPTSPPTSGLCPRTFTLLHMSRTHVISHSSDPHMLAPLPDRAAEGVLGD